MIRHSGYFKLFPLMLICIGIAACTPSFETTAEKCVTYFPVVLNEQKTNDNTEFQVLANRTSNDYKLYLEDALNSFKNVQHKNGDGSTSPLTADEQTAVDFLLTKAASNMGYVLTNGSVTSASNPLDYLESLLVATDLDEAINAFESAKQNMNEAIKSGSDYCNYRNPGITLQVEDPEIPSTEDNIIETVRAILTLYFNPFSDVRPDDVLQDFVIGTDEPLDDLNILDRKANSFAGSTRFDKSEYQINGSSPMLARSLNQSSSLNNQVFEYADVFMETKSGTFDITELNQVCLLKDEDGNIILGSRGQGIVTTCPEGTITRTPAHDSCKGGEDANGNELTDDTGTIEINNFSPVPGNDLLEDIQRLRIEIDYEDAEIRFYASKYELAILRAGITDPETADPATDIIYNPTACEQSAVRAEMKALLPTSEQANATITLNEVYDPYFDRIISEDDEGNEVIEVEPTPIFTLQGSLIPERQ